MKKKLSPLMMFHLALMAILALATLVSLIVLLMGNGADNVDVYYGAFSFGPQVSALLNLAALACGIIYLLKGYRKEASNYYKAFIAMMAAFYAITAYPGYVTDGFSVGVILQMVKIILLLVLAFAKDLGKRNTWIVFWVMIAVYAVFLMVKNNFAGMALYRIVVVFSKLVMDGTIGLAIKGKYDDKDARGAV